MKLSTGKDSSRGANMVGGVPTSPSLAAPPTHKPRSIPLCTSKIKKLKNEQHVVASCSGAGVRRESKESASGELY